MSRTILLVEDNEHIMQINRDTLAEAGYRVLEAETALRYAGYVKRQEERRPRALWKLRAVRRVKS